MKKRYNSIMPQEKNSKSETPRAKKGAAKLTPANATGQREIGGRKRGLEPTRYGDWEKNGRCIDF